MLQSAPRHKTTLKLWVPPLQGPFCQILSENKNLAEEMEFYIDDQRKRKETFGSCLASMCVCLFNSPLKILSKEGIYFHFFYQTHLRTCFDSVLSHLGNSPGINWLDFQVFLEDTCSNCFVLHDYPQPSAKSLPSWPLEPLLGTSECLF